MLALRNRFQARSISLINITKQPRADYEVKQVTVV